MINNSDWIQEFPAAITVCDRDGKILAMNKNSAFTFANDGGAQLVGENLLNCHPESARTKVIDLLRSARPNVYTIEKEGLRKLIYQSPWYQNGEYAGFVELSLPIPEKIPHFIRDAVPGR